MSTKATTTKSASAKSASAKVKNIDQVNPEILKAEFNKAEKATKPAKKAAPAPTVIAKSAISSEAVLLRDMSDGCRNLFMATITASADWSDCPPTYEVMPVKGSTVKKDEGHLTALKKLGLVTTQVDTDNKDIAWISFTHTGKQLKEFIEAGKHEPEIVVVDGTKEATPAPAPAKKAVKEAAPAKTPAPAKVKAPVVKIDRAKLRYAAIQHVMAAVKADSWKKADYKPMLKHLEATYTGLYAKLKTPEKVHAYSTGIVDFCLAACRKLDKKA